MSYPRSIRSDVTKTIQCDQNHPLISNLSSLMVSDGLDVKPRALIIMFWHLNPFDWPLGCRDLRSYTNNRCKVNTQQTHGDLLQQPPIIASSALLFLGVHLAQTGALLGAPFEIQTSLLLDPVYVNKQYPSMSYSSAIVWIQDSSLLGRRLRGLVNMKSF